MEKKIDKDSRKKNKDLKRQKAKKEETKLQNPTREEEDRDMEAKETMN